uniref:Prostaglandin-H2 D-isomerase n=1 Tax=Pogona vitticeps TaxID=103695 RepID=A0A6J0V2P2_9SAUR
MWARVCSFLAVAVACLVVARGEVPVQPDFQQEQFVGRWYSIGLASNSQWFQDKKQTMKMCTTVVTPVAGGGLDVTSTYPKHDQCETRNSVFVPTDQPGRFTYSSPRSATTSDIRVVETNYDEYALLSGQKVKGGETFMMVTLYGRSKQVRPELVEKFTQLALDQGLTRDQILVLPRTDQCMEESV